MSPAAATARLVRPFADNGFGDEMTAEDEVRVRTIGQRVAALPALVDVIDYLFDQTQDLIPCDRISLAFVEEDGRRVVQRHVRTAYEPLLLGPGYTDDLTGTSLAPVFETGRPRVIDDLEHYMFSHPNSRSAELLVHEGIRSSLACPLSVEGRVLGLLFRSARRANAFTPRHVELQVTISGHLCQAVERAWRIEQLEEANRAYLKMLGFVSHELKSPVASMVTDARLVADGYFGPIEDDARAKLERLIQKGDYLLQLVRDYLDLARVEGGELRAQFVPNVSLETSVIWPSIEIVRPQLEERGMTATVDSSQTPRLLADCDPTLLEIVLVNLLTNAVKYGREGGRVVIRLTAERNRVSVSVWNEGQGFTHADDTHLFRRFSRLKSAKAAGQRGTGLGLYTSWRIVQLHHGRIRAASRFGEWAEFSFEIPQPLPPLGAPAAEDSELPDEFVE